MSGVQCSNLLPRGECLQLAGLTSEKPKASLLNRNKSFKVFCRPLKHNMYAAGCKMRGNKSGGDFPAEIQLKQISSAPDS